MSLSFVLSLALLMVSTSAAGVISALSPRRSWRFSALGVSLVAAALALIVAGVDLGGRLGRDAAERDNRSAVTGSVWT
jgi:VIT1/CCC1 family predicted Fe2+/Mn2+ transporter